MSNAREGDLAVRIAHIVPPDWTNNFPLGEYRMALAHWVFKYPAYAAQLRSNQDAYILMDSGSFEGQQVSVDQINEAADALKADEVVLPDVPGDSKETLKRSWDALGKIATKRVMFVPQGRTHEEWCKCLDSWLSQWSKHSWRDSYDLSIGVASLRAPGSTKTVVGTKAKLLQVALGRDFSIHLLGLPHLGNHVKDILPVRGVRGIDTSTAFALGARGILVTPTAKKIRLGDPEQYAQLDTNARRLITLNMRILESWGAADAKPEVIQVYLIRQTASKWLKYYAQGFASVTDVMKACGMPKGRYALLRQRRREMYVRPLTRFEKLTDKEILVEVKK
jgi:hypothetical protein